MYSAQTMINDNALKMPMQLPHNEKVIVQSRFKATVTEGSISINLFASEKAYEDKAQTVYGDYLLGAGLSFFLSFFLLLYLLFL